MRNWLSVLITDAKSKKESDIPIAPSLYSLSNEMDKSLLAVRDINHKYIVVEKIEELMNIYQEYIDKETSKEKKRNRIILTIFSAFAGVLTISFENMGVIGIDFTNWLYVATFLLVFVATAGIWIYSYTFFDTLKRKYELMIKDLKDLLLLKY